MDEEGNGEVIWEHRGNRAAGEGGREEEKTDGGVEGRGRRVEGYGRFRKENRGTGGWRVK